MKIVTNNNRKLSFRQVDESKIWESAPEFTNVDGFISSNYNFSFKNDLRLREYIVENYDFYNYIETFINYFIENEKKILKISRKVIDDISNINGENYTLNEENSKLSHVRILDIVKYSFKITISTDYGYDNYEISFVTFDKENLSINKIIKTQCY